MKKEEYLSRIDEVIAQGPYTDSETNGIPEICI